MDFIFFFPILCDLRHLLDVMVTFMAHLGMLETGASNLRLGLKKEQNDHFIHFSDWYGYK